MSNKGIKQVWNDTPHALVTSEVSFDAESNSDFDLDATIQFVCNGHAAAFDFSAFIFVTDDLTNLESERQRLTNEIAGVNNLLEAVEKFHGDFLAEASAALDRLQALQASTQS